MVDGAPEHSKCLEVSAISTSPTPPPAGNDDVGLLESTSAGDQASEDSEMTLLTDSGSLPRTA